MKWKSLETGTDQSFLILYSEFIAAAQSQSFLCDEVCFIVVFSQNKLDPFPYEMKFH